eukprot:185317_1
MFKPEPIGFSASFGEHTAFRHFIPSSESSRSRTSSSPRKRHPAVTTTLPETPSGPSHDQQSRLLLELAKLCLKRPKLPRSSDAESLEFSWETICSRSSGHLSFLSLYKQSIAPAWRLPVMDIWIVLKNSRAFCEGVYNFQKTIPQPIVQKMRAVDQRMCCDKPGKVSDKADGTVPRFIAKLTTLKFRPLSVKDGKSGMKTVERRMGTKVFWHRGIIRDPARHLHWFTTSAHDVWKYLVLEVPTNQIQLRMSAVRDRMEESEPSSAEPKDPVCIALRSSLKQARDSSSSDDDSDRNSDDSSPSNSDSVIFTELKAPRSDHLLGPPPTLVVKLPRQPQLPTTLPVFTCSHSATSMFESLRYTPQSPSRSSSPTSNSSGASKTSSQTEISREKSSERTVTVEKAPKFSKLYLQHRTRVEKVASGPVPEIRCASLPAAFDCTLRHPGVFRQAEPAKSGDSDSGAACLGRKSVVPGPKYVGDVRVVRDVASYGIFEQFERFRASRYVPSRDSSKLRDYKFKKDPETARLQCLALVSVVGWDREWATNVGYCIFKGEPCRSSEQSHPRLPCYSIRDTSTGECLACAYVSARLTVPVIRRHLYQWSRMRRKRYKSCIEQFEVKRARIEKAIGLNIAMSPLFVDHVGELIGDT